MSAGPDQDQRKLPPSPKRIRDFRKRGEIARSRDLTTIATVAGGLIAASMFAQESFVALVELLRQALSMSLHPAELGAVAGRAAIGAAAPTAIGSLAGYLLSVAVQLGWPPALKPLGFELGKIAGWQGLAQILSLKEASKRLLSSTAKVAVILTTLGMSIYSDRDALFSAPPASVEGVLAHLGNVASTVITYGAMALAVLAAVDFVLQKRQLHQRMMMTPEEAKQEHKEQEGNPEIKRARRRRQREMAKKRYEMTVPTADVVVVNPTHYAVALRYKSAKDRAPKVIAKGRGPIAQRIRDIARKNGIPIIAQPPLARMLHKAVPEGGEVPANLYQAVAEVLAYVYRLRKRTK